MRIYIFIGLTFAKNKVAKETISVTGTAINLLA